MTMLVRPFAFGLALTLMGAACVQAKEYNRSKHLDAKSQVTVHKALADAHRRSAGNEQSRDIVNQGCGNLNVGNVEVGAGAAPREVVTVITGDVINVNNGCR